MSVRSVVNISAFIVALGMFFVISKIFGIAFLLIYFLVIEYPTILIIIGNSNYSKNRIDVASKYFEKVYKCFYAPVKLKISYTYVLILQGKLQESEKIIINILKRKLSKSEKMDLEINLSLVMWKKGELDRAIEILENLYKNYKTIIIYQNLGYFLILKGDYSKSLDFNSGAYDYDASNPGILDNLAQNYYLLGNYDKAIELFETLMKKNPTFPSAYYNYALALLKKNKFEEALENFKKAINCKFTFLTDITKTEIEIKIKEIENN